jgi:hypothetical protein
MPHRLRQVVLFGAPIFVGVLNVTHPMVKSPIYDGIAGPLFSASHVTPTGPLAMACFLGATINVELVVGGSNR